MNWEVGGEIRIEKDPYVQALHACNHSYIGGRLGGLQFKSSLAKS
jgi:hypothetical protein